MGREFHEKLGHEFFELFRDFSGGMEFVLPLWIFLALILGVVPLAALGGLIALHLRGETLNILEGFALRDLPVPFRVPRRINFLMRQGRGGSMRHDRFPVDVLQKHDRIPRTEIMPGVEVAAKRGPFVPSDAPASDANNLPDRPRQ